QITQTHWLQGQQQLQFESEYKQWSQIESDYKQCLYVKNLGAVRDESHVYQALEYSGGLSKGAAYRLPYSQDESMDEGHYEHPQHMRSYASAWSMRNWAGQPVPATAAFLWDDLAVMVVEGLLNQIKLMKRQRMSMLEQIERVGKCKAPVFKEPMVEPKRARAPSQCPQELAWMPVHTIA
ncbi:hypothetical protein C0995_002550, partial [Termitomyces sp. Mi166